MAKLYFASDYMETACPQVLAALTGTQGQQFTGYGTDRLSEAARARIRTACQAPEADVYFLTGGTQTNQTVIDSMLAGYQGVLTADTGHINVHEAGAIEFTGHKVISLPMSQGKITAAQVEKWMKNFRRDANWDHMVTPGMVYISQPTEYGTLYSRRELAALSRTAHRYGLRLFVDGARLAYALAARGNDVRLEDLAHYCDVFYIGGTKCGAMTGECVVIPHHDAIPRFFTCIKQHGALLAKGWVNAVQFDALFTPEADGRLLYEKLGRNGDETADEIRTALKKYGYPLYLGNPTNQVFFVLPDKLYKKMSRKVVLGYMEAADETHAIVRICTSWATTKENVAHLKAILKDLSKEL